MRNEIPEKAHLLKALASCPSSWTTCGFVPSLAPLAYTAQTFASQACWWDCSKETHAHAHNCDTHSPLDELCKINKTCWGIEWNWFTAHVYCVCLRLRRTSTMPPCQQARKATIFVQATKDPILTPSSISTRYQIVTASLQGIWQALEVQQNSHQKTWWNRVGLNVRANVHTELSKL